MIETGGEKQLGKFMQAARDADDDDFLWSIIQSKWILLYSIHYQTLLYWNSVIKNMDLQKSQNKYISTFVGYLMPNPFLCKSVLFQTNQFSMSTQFNCQKHFYFKLFKQLYITIQFSISTVSMPKIVQFKTIQFSKSMQFKCKYS